MFFFFCFFLFFLEMLLCLGNKHTDIFLEVLKRNWPCYQLLLKNEVAWHSNGVHACHHCWL